jgi:hypothetical protein
VKQALNEQKEAMIRRLGCRADSKEFGFNFRVEMRVPECVTAVVTGILDRYDDAQDDQGILASVLKLLEMFLALWAETCGLDYFDRNRADRCSSYNRQQFTSFYYSVQDHQPLLECWRRRRENGLPIINTLLGMGYKPSHTLVWSSVWHSLRLLARIHFTDSSSSS